MQVVAWGQGVMDAQRWIKEIEPDPETFGQLLERLRLAAGMTQNELSNAMYGRATRQNSISAWEADRILPSVPMVKLIADALGADFSELNQRRGEQELRNLERPRDLFPGPTIATGNRPGMREVMTELIAFDDLDQVKDALHTFRTRPETLDAFRAFMAEVIANDADPEQAAKELAASQDELSETMTRLGASQTCTSKRKVPR